MEKQGKISHEIQLGDNLHDKEILLKVFYKNYNNLDILVCLADIIKNKNGVKNKLKNNSHEGSDL